MNKIKKIVSGHSTAESRWARFGPYYAMFPIDFAFKVVNKYSKKGDFILDPFAGRASSVFAGGVLGRHSLGIEINPVGWLYGSTKLCPADKKRVLEKLNGIYAKRNFYSRSIQKLPEFYRICYCDEVLKFLLAARKNLKWQTDTTDATLMSILLIYLHGKIGEGLSNQMRMTKAMGINYSVEWWKKNNFLTPPEINPLEFITQKINWRYSKGTPKIHDSYVIYGDSVDVLSNIVNKSITSDIKFSLLFTSPPYWSVTDYHADQWLRLWLLGENDLHKSNNHKYKGRFASRTEYYKLLDNVFADCAKLMNDYSVVYVRTDKRVYTFTTTLEILKKHFPNHELEVKNQPFKRKTQTQLHGNSSNENGEIDIILIKKPKIHSMY